MGISILKNLSVNQITPELAYMIGLIYPRIVIKQLRDQRYYVIGSVNHNYDQINSNNANLLSQHFMDVDKMVLGDAICSKCVQLEDNHENNNYGSLSSKKGFSILINVDDCKDENGNILCSDVVKILTDVVNVIKISSNSVRESFIKGCFDGRSSYDTTAGFLSVDVDREYSRQDLVDAIASSVGIYLNLNRRDVNHSKNDQLRIRPESLNDFCSRIGLLSGIRGNRLREFGFTI